MALESCKVLMLSYSYNSYHFCIREGLFKTNGWVEWSRAFPRILSERIIFDVRPGDTTDLMPISFVKFNNDGE